MKKYEKVAEENLLYCLVEKGKLSVSEAAQEVNLSDEQFCAQMETYGYKIPAV
jgi:hypothetical protein